ncbi:class I SAM-dependent methyltransferase [Mariniblastus fucicola]|uniref:Ribosomal RNA large subunit methyltransferase K n=1 Tax=Mariniblastus fucicola TaxID=980251 RepID=A0A5B9P663_9BACT|nr:class I SAM-dependent methyltransferase [Mariniblastus fucicola]QEG21818.1 Ribosomal RNA large subunit methyltransferase K [Mariniblastus fucicola]
MDLALVFESEQYELIDFGDGTKVERFGDRIVARESPSVEMFEPKMPLGEVEVDASFDSRDGDCRWHGELDSEWATSHSQSQFSLRQTPTGQVGVFPEQAANWDWIAKHADVVSGKKAINLFAYTGGSTLALAAAGAHITHVDSASSVVTWARENAAKSGLADRPIRWIVEDAMKFVQREIKRGNSYDIFVADPPSFGRGKKNETWKIERDLEDLVELAKALCPDPKMVILSCHTPTWDASDLEFVLERQFASHSEKFEAFALSLNTNDGRTLPSGDCARFVVED